jgi:hypothetical protein
VNSIPVNWPKHRILVIILASVWIFGWSANGVIASPADHGWLAFGDLRGFLEPCGCDPATDLGGLPRILTSVARERLTTPHLIVLNLGNSTDLNHPNKIKDRFIWEGLARIKPTASLFNISEMEWMESVQRPDRVDESMVSSQKFVLSNARKSHSYSWLKEMRDADNGVVLGYTFSPKTSRLSRRVDLDLLNQWRKILSATHQEKNKILLFSGPDEDLILIKEAKIFDVIISSHTAPLGTVPGVSDKENDTLLERKVDSKGSTKGSGADVWMVPLAGQGLLRGGMLLNREAASIAKLFQPSDSKNQGSTTLGDTGIQAALVPPRRISWLSSDVGINAEAKVFYDAYMNETRKAFVEESSRRLKDLSSSPFAGSDSCIGCHPKASVVFKSSKHARALETLISKNKEQDPECVLCHTVGAQLQGGFVSAKKSPHLAGVQCENCHGARKAHVQNPSLKGQTQASIENVCLQCHNSQHSPKFDRQAYWLQISHGRE